MTMISISLEESHVKIWVPYDEIHNVKILTIWGVRHPQNEPQRKIFICQSFLDQLKSLLLIYEVCKRNNNKFEILPIFGPPRT